MLEEEVSSYQMSSPSSASKVSVRFSSGMGLKQSRSRIGARRKQSKYQQLFSLKREMFRKSVCFDSGRKEQTLRPRSPEGLVRANREESAKIRLGPRGEHLSGELDANIRPQMHGFRAVCERIANIKDSRGNYHASTSESASPGILRSNYRNSPRLRLHSLPWFSTGFRAVQSRCEILQRRSMSVSIRPKFPGRQSLCIWCTEGPPFEFFVTLEGSR